MLDKNTFDNKVNILGGVDETKLTVVKCGGYNRVLGGATEYGFKQSLLNANDVIQSQHAENVAKYLSEKYNIKKDYFDALKQTSARVSSALSEDDVSPPDETIYGSGEMFHLKERYHEQLKNNIIKGLATMDELNIIPAMPEYPTCNIRDSDIAKIYKGPGTPIEKSRNIEKMFYEHMLRVEEYYVEITKILYEINSKLPEID